MKLEAPQLIYIGLSMFGLGVAMSRHGEPNTSNYNFFTTLIGTVLGVFLLYWGGFF